MKVVSNSSPLIILYKCEELELLHQLFGTVLIPEAVHHEVVQNTSDPQQSRVISSCDFIHIHSVHFDQPSFSYRIDQGEAEAIALAATVAADYLLLDDKRAQKEARLQGIEFIPTFAVLLKAAQRKLIPSFEAVLRELETKHIFLSRELNRTVRSFLDEE